ncbi:MAG: hypothetical protein QXZ20_03325 [Candidatus Aenigmatarchaeota archaeon]
MNKNSPHYMKSSYEVKCYGNDKYTTLERKLDVTGNDRDRVRSASSSIKSAVMP